MTNLIIVSNRLPVNLRRRKKEFISQPSAGGVATGIESLKSSYDLLWIGWPGLTVNNDGEKTLLRERLYQDKMIPVFLTSKDILEYYEGFSNKTIWPLFNYFIQNVIYEDKYWRAYKNVNNKFCDQVVALYKENDTIWVHDYQLMLLPQMLRERLPEASIGFFLHIPFPSYELFRLLPQRKEVLEGILGADLVGFHTYDYARHFLSSIMRLLGLEQKMGAVATQDRIIRVDTFPMGIDFQKFARGSSRKHVKAQVSRYEKMKGHRKIILSLDRLDYSKGILQRLTAFDLFLTNNPHYKEQVSFIMLVVPSRTKVESYQKLKHSVDEYVGRINGHHGTIDWVPVYYFYRTLPFDGVSALYNIADVCLVTPYRDGMNLVCKEYVATKVDSPGVLILSEMAGARHELHEALIVNPNDIRVIVKALEKAFTMPDEEKTERMKSMQDKLKRYDIRRWAQDFIDNLQKVKKSQGEMSIQKLGAAMHNHIVAAFKRNRRRILLLDYDGTLVPFASMPDLAKPDHELIALLKELGQHPGVDIVIISGRTKPSLDEWLGQLNVHLVAEHGAWIKEKGGDWYTLEPFHQEWKKDIRPILELYVDRTPGALLEEKSFALAWHFRNVDVGLAEIRAHELADTLRYFTSNLDLQVIEGKKVVEIKNRGMNKGRAALHFLAQKSYNFILAVGDDWTDEDIFQVLPEDAYSIKVGLTSTSAKNNLKSVKEVRTLLNDLLKGSDHEKTR
ncbi:bifunctional alpha,alpha-trehalose-phosphate synthase (UDP-forming)/trehalose-phosphatase [candidate division KSB1 bacterium RBG_16_48_16]|nr:MAG: bifunctional alpha,alpha-trehalose-phosphate synthase (UDP-forming)/trehalose-phosphatase [candidate division KSB1 bacterium RBG_16_48_16]